MSQPNAKDQKHIDVRYIAELARIELTDEETERYGKQLDDVLEYVNKLQELNVDDIEPMAHAVPRHNVMRDDQVRLSMDRREMLENAPATTQQFIKVPAILDEEENA